jgi:hypothetical protein
MGSIPTGPTSPYQSGQVNSGVNLNNVTALRDAVCVCTRYRGFPHHEPILKSTVATTEAYSLHRRVQHGVTVPTLYPQLGGTRASRASTSSAGTAGEKR